MKKNYKKFIFPAICVLVVVLTFVLLFDMKNKASKIADSRNANEVNSENVVDNTNTNTNTVENIVDENSVQNETVENTNTNTNTTNEEVKTPQTAVTSGDDDKLAENKQKQAIELVKQKWGTDSKVYFTNESVNSKGEYIVAARDKSSTEVKNYFKVNIETGTVEVDY